MVGWPPIAIIPEYSENYLVVHRQDFIKARIFTPSVYGHSNFPDMETLFSQQASTYKLSTS
ncbi:hypothetical protein HRM2_19140 [Desulforapulum autotrophicum HRM2]|uniref:Uncharacterized protein n=1 Tax=Desulforapulum autotrophicum (strain ATCC 43914 / DSM 3382 / VKM B-1955 / HRM2) TaxID=177437 RepID=C0QC03_DESAH|nr:hypothetical protein HRM2_19140 [Desulforapulum autotrophicum HRM2]